MINQLNFNLHTSVYYYTSTHKQPSMNIHIDEAASIVMVIWSSVMMILALGSIYVSRSERRKRAQHQQEQGAISEFKAYVNDLKRLTTEQLKQSLASLQNSKKEALRRMLDERLGDGKWPLDKSMRTFITQCSLPHDKYIEAVMNEIESPSRVDSTTSGDSTIQKDICATHSKGCIYFIKAFGKVKIGHTYNITKRLADLQRSCPTEMMVWFSIETDDVVNLEAKLHETFACRRYMGDWYDLHSDDLWYLSRHPDYAK